MRFLSLTIGNTVINPPANLPQPGAGMVEKIINNSITIFLVAGVVVSVLVIAWGGITWITSGGEKQKLAAARARITWAAIGLIIMFIAFLVINLFSSFFGVNLLSSNL